MTGLQFQVVPVAFTKGQDTRTQSKLLLPGKWQSLINYSLSEDNTPRRRDGSTAVVSGATGNGLFMRGAELLTVSGPNVSSVSSTAAATVARSGVPGYVGISKTEVQRSSGMQDCPDVASSGSLTCYVWRSKSSTNAIVGHALTLVDETSGAAILSNVAIHTSATSDWIRVVAASDAFFVFYRDGGNIFCRVIVFTAPTALGGETAIIGADVGGATFGDACAFGAQAMVAYPGGGGAGTAVYAALVGRAGTTPSVSAGPTNAIDTTSLTLAGLTAITCCLYGNATRAIVAATGNAGTKSGLAGTVLNSSMVITAGPTRLSATTSTTTSVNHLCAVAESGTSVRIFRDFISELGTNALNSILEQQVDNTLGTVVGSTAVIPTANFGAGVVARGPEGPFIHGKPFTNGTNIFLPVFVFSVYNNLSASSSNPRNANTQNTFFLVDCGRPNLGFFDAAVVCGRALYGTLGVASINGNTPTISTCSSPATSGSSVFASLVGELTLLVLSSGNNISPTGLVRLTMSPNTSTPLSRCELGESAYLAGGQLSMYDGQAVAEQCFPLFPEGVGFTAGGGGTGAMSDGTYQVVAVYAWVDNAGQRHLSAPSLPVTVTLSAGVATQSILMNIPTLLVSQKSGAEILVFRTVNAGLTLFRCNLNAGAYTPVANTTAATTVNFRCSESDTSIAANEVLYTQPLLNPTTLPSFAPPPCSYVWTGHNRLWFDKADKPGWFGYSQEYVNNVGLQFNDALEDNLPPASGGLVAGATMDEKIIIFGAKRIYAKFGTGPQPSGAFNNYTRAEDIQADVGCKDPLSVIQMSKGIIFKAQSGFHLLGRDLSVNYIGEGVKAYDGYTIVSAVLMQDRQEIRFEARSSPSSSGDGVVLVFSYLLGEWSVFRRGSSATHPDGASDSVWWSATGTYVVLLASGVASGTSGVFKDVPLFNPDGSFTGSSSDDYSNSGTQSAVTTSGTTAWLRLSVLESFQRVRRVYVTGTPLSSGLTPRSTFNISVSVNDDSTVVDTANAAPVVSTVTIDIRHKLVVQKCKSVMFTFSDVPPGTGQANMAGIQAIALEIGIKRGVNKLSAAQTV